MVMPGSSNINDIFNAGASMVSLRVCPILSCMGVIKGIVNELLNDDSSQIINNYFYVFSEAESLFN